MLQRVFQHLGVMRVSGSISQSIGSTKTGSEDPAIDEPMHSRELGHCRTDITAVGRGQGRRICRTVRKYEQSTGVMVSETTSDSKNRDSHGNAELEKRTADGP